MESFFSGGGYVPCLGIYLSLFQIRCNKTQLFLDLNILNQVSTCSAHHGIFVVHLQAVMVPCFMSSTALKLHGINCVTVVILFDINLSLCSESEFVYSTRPEHTHRPCPSQCCQAKGHLQNDMSGLYQHIHAGDYLERIIASIMISVKGNQIINCVSFIQKELNEPGCLKKLVRYLVSSSMTSRKFSEFFLSICEVNHLVP